LLNPLAVDLDARGGFGDCERCPRSFASTMAAMLTFTQQVVATDAWGDTCIPIIEAYPATSMFFGAVLVTVNLGLMNLILSVIVGKATQARAADVAFIMQQKEEEFEILKKQLVRLCSQLDQDNSQCLTLDELLDGFDNNPEFKTCMEAMDVERNDIEGLFYILDDDGSGEVEYDEFVDQLHKTKTQDSHVVLVFVRGHVKEITKDLEKQKLKVDYIDETLKRGEDRYEEVQRLCVELAGKERKRPPSVKLAPSIIDIIPFSGRGPASARAVLGSCCGSSSSGLQEKSQDLQANSELDGEVVALREKVAKMKALVASLVPAEQGQPRQADAPPEAAIPFEAAIPRAEPNPGRLLVPVSEGSSTHVVMGSSVPGGLTLPEGAVQVVHASEGSFTDLGSSSDFVVATASMVTQK